VVAGTVASAVLLTLAVRAHVNQALLLLVAAIVPLALLFIVRWDPSWHLAYDVPGSCGALAWALYRRAHSELWPPSAGALP
jgi:hypothetical protein